MNDIKDMKLYSDAYRIFKDLKAIGYSEDDKLNLVDLNQFDQLHYHGTLSVQEAIETINIQENDNVLEVEPVGEDHRDLLLIKQEHMFLH